MTGWIRSSQRRPPPPTEKHWTRPPMHWREKQKTLSAFLRMDPMTPLRCLRFRRSTVGGFGLQPWSSACPEGFRGRRRERVVRIFPTMDAARRLIGARCAEQHEEWSTGRRYLTMDAFFAWERAQAEHAEAEPDPTTTPLPLAA